MQKLLTGIQPSGKLHLGSYLGMIRQAAKMLNSYESYFMLADLHTITVPQKPEDLRSSCYELTATYIAAGLDPKKAAIFSQAAVSEHSELAWILGCNTSMGWLSRMTQYKEKSEKYKDHASLGLYAYPVLMAADILVYKADIVPVGEDQKQHLELTRDIAAAFNRNYNVDFFKLPEPKILESGARIMSLKDGTCKMSKSDESDLSRINLLDSRDEILKKFKKAKTDSIENIYYDKVNRPDISNLLTIFSCLSNRPVKEIASEYEYGGFAKFKGDLGELVATEIAPLSAEISKLLADKTYLNQVLKDGADKAKKVASATVAEVKEICGFL